MVEKLQKRQDIFERENNQVRRENLFLREKIRLLIAERFARHSERFTADLDGMQKCLFELEQASEEQEEPEQDEVTIDIPAHKRKKTGRKALPASLERVEVLHDIPEAAKQCACGAQMSPIGQETSEQLQIIPAKLWVERHVRPKYACRACEGLESIGSVVKMASPPPQMIPKSMASASLLAHLFVGKFCDALPFHRQEQQFTRYGVELTRASMCNWALKAAARLEPLRELLRMEILDEVLVGVDETPVQVLDEPGRTPESKSYMWVFRGGTSGAVYYHYSPSRAAKTPQEFLHKYEGYVQTDGYQAYNFLDNDKKIVHVGCWAHVRRKFHQASKASDALFNGKGKGSQALKIIKRLYEVDREARLKGYDTEQTRMLRQEKSKPIILEFKAWLDEHAHKAPPESLIGKAFSYALSQWPKLARFLDDGVISLDNNLVENAIRPFVVGRKNWLFSQTPQGAATSALFYSLIETAKAKNLDPYRYLRFLFEQYPLAQTPQDVFQLLPANINKSDFDNYQFQSNPPH
jgi:transposase